ncbi:RNA-guided pseudouridylation complex pseudouridine synthase subunit Cbf5 [Halobacteriales archaeon SW_10_66_29]|nr:MAG: RNA-guided pseudouridylation complex pseudouridine synthase subunit Cbf5 [Halobacteriales archaeon SW_10_66_29]
MTLRDPPGDRSPAALLPFGLVNLDKPPGPSAHQVAEWVRELTRDALADRQESDALDGADSAGHPPALVDRVAHAGTLDPKVTGSLPLMLGDATRLAQVFDDSRKEYVAVLELHGPPPSDFEAIVAEFEGEIYQKPPRKSAVRRQLRVREIFELDVIERRERQALLGIRCESGTYVRKLCHDIGLALGTGAHMGDLRRTATGTFDDTTLVTMEEFVDALAFWVEDDDPEPLEAVVDPAERALVTLPRVTIAPSAAREVAQGAPVYAPGVIDVAPAEGGGGEPTDDALVACYTPNGAAVCLGRLVGDPDADSGTVVDLERVLV